MAELDYAFLADYAVVENGRLTAVGASFTHVKVPDLPFQKALCAAMRVRVPADESSFHLKVELRAPERAWVIGANVPVDASAAEPYDGKRGIIVAAQIDAMLTRVGLYEVEIFIDDQSVRLLKFDVSTD